MTFHDEFDGTSVDPSKWNFTYRWDDLALLGNGEQQWYAPDAVTVSGGLMHFTTTKEDYYWPKMGTTQHYRSGMVASYDKFSQQYGYFVIRAKMPAGQGFWPAFWLLPQSGAWPPEIDVLEILGHQPERVYMTFHYNNPDHQSNGTYYDISPSSAAAFHTYGVEWSAGAIVWYIDEVEHHRVTQFIPTEPFYIIANLTVGGYWPGNPDGTTPFPSVMDVDYIRVYERQAGSTDPVPGP
jgi:beta-glucanase (GH16 family)